MRKSSSRWFWIPMCLLAVAMAVSFGCNGNGKETPDTSVADPTPATEPVLDESRLMPVRPDPGPGTIVRVKPKTPGSLSQAEWEVNQTPAGFNGPYQMSDKFQEVVDMLFLSVEREGAQYASLDRVSIKIHSHEDPEHADYELRVLKIDKNATGVIWTMTIDGSPVTWEPCDADVTTTSVGDCDDSVNSLPGVFDGWIQLPHAPVPGLLPGMTIPDEWYAFVDFEDD